MHEWMRRIRGRELPKGKKAAVLTSAREGRAEGRGVGDLREDDLEALDAAVNTFTQFPELRTEG